MSLIKWRNSFSTGIERFDNDHKKILNLIATLYNSIYVKKNKWVTEEALKELVAYTGYHFTNEEEHMKLHDYPEYAEHKKEHDELTVRVKKLQTEFISTDKDMSREIYALLREWFQHHILEVDLKYGPFFKKAGMS